MGAGPPAPKPPSRGKEVALPVARDFPPSRNAPKPTYPPAKPRRRATNDLEYIMNNIIWIVGAVVIVIAILGFLGLA